MSSTVKDPTIVDFLGVLGSTYAAPADDRAASLDPTVAATVTAMAARLIPGDEHWPSGAQVGAAEHVSAVLAAAEPVREAVLEMIATAGTGFAGAASDEERDAVLSALEADPRHSASFRALYEWVCEAYYRHPSVVPVIEERTGFALRRPLIGTPMPPFDESRLDRVRALPPRYWSAS